MTLSATLTSAPPDGEPSTGEVLAYISDMLGQLADLARSMDKRRLELAIRLLALEAATEARPGAPRGAPS